MLDNLLQNKYFCIAIILALGWTVYMYSKKNSCDVEEMRNLDLTPTAQELTETAWTTKRGASDYKEVNNKFDKFADEFTKKKLLKNGYKVTDFLKRSDDKFIEYSEREGFKSESDIPRPHDSRPDLSQCQPCNCKTDKLMAIDSDSDSESDQVIVIKKKSKKNKKN